MEEEHGQRLDGLVAESDALTGRVAVPISGATGTALSQDMLASALRRASLGYRPDALMRLERATELLAIGRLVVRHGHTHKRSTPAVLLESLQALRDLGDPVGAYHADHGEELERLLHARARNHAAWGVDPIDRPSWESLAGPWRTWLEGAFTAIRAAADDCRTIEDRPSAGPRPPK